jgi:hypothetical protein
VTITLRIRCLQPTEEYTMSSDNYIEDMCGFEATRSESVGFALSIKKYGVDGRFFKDSFVVGEMLKLSRVV